MTFDQLEQKNKEIKERKWKIVRQIITLVLGICILIGFLVFMTYSTIKSNDEYHQEVSLWKDFTLDQCVVEEIYSTQVTGNGIKFHEKYILVVRSANCNNQSIASMFPNRDSFDFTYSEKISCWTHTDCKGFVLNHKTNEPSYEYVIISIFINIFLGIGTLIMLFVWTYSDITLINIICVLS